MESENLITPLEFLLPSNYLYMTKVVTGFLAILVSVCSTLSGGLTYQVVHFISQPKDRHGISTSIAIGILILTLLGMSLEILIFKSFTYHGLVDVGFITIHSWPLCLLTVINYLVSTICRIYFARLASTMLRSPQTFLCLSLIFLVLTVVGLTAEVFSIALHASALPFHQVIPHPNQSPVWLILSRPTFFIIIEIIWLISAFAWELMIMRVLLSNFLDPQKRFRFGLIDGKCSFGVTLIFESALLSTLVTMAVIPCYFILTYKVTIDYGRLCIIFGTISSFVAKLDAISILCSLQHKQHSRVRAGLKIISNTMRNPRLSGQRWSVGSGEMMAARKSIKELPTVTFPNLNRNSQLLQRDSIQYQTSEHPTAELRWSEPSSSDRKPTEMNRQLTCSNQSLSSVASLENEEIEKSVKASERSSIEMDLESADHMIVVKNSAVDPLDCDRRRRGTRDFSALPLDTPISLPPPTKLLERLGFMLTSNFFLDFTQAHPFRQARADEPIGVFAHPCFHR